MESIASSKRMNSIARVRFDQDSFDLDAATTHNEEGELERRVTFILRRHDRNMRTRRYFGERAELFVLVLPGFEGTQRGLLVCISGFGREWSCLGI